VTLLLVAAVVLGACGPLGDGDPSASTAVSLRADDAPRSPTASVATAPPTATPSESFGPTSPAPAPPSAPLVRSTTVPPPQSAAGGPPPVAQNCESPDPLPAVVDPSPLVTSDDGVRVRMGPGVACEVLEALDANADVRPLSGLVEADAVPWLLVEAGAVQGWVAAEFVGVDSVTAGAEVIVLVYHHLDHPDTDWSVTSVQLAAQLTWLKDQGYESVTISRLAAAMRGEEALPPHTVVITNDDGYAETPAFAALLKQHGFVGTYYLPSRMELTPDDVKALEAGGGEVCAHTASHSDLTELDAAAQRAEIAPNAALLEDILGHPVRCFAYPFGRGNDDTVAILQDLRFESAVTMDGQPARFGEVADPFRIARIPALGNLTIKSFAAIFPEGAPTEQVAVEEEIVEEPLPIEEPVYEESVDDETVYEDPTIYEEPEPEE